MSWSHQGERDSRRLRSCGRGGFPVFRADCADEVGIDDLAVGGYLGLFDEEDCVGAFDSFGLGAVAANALGEEPAPFVGETFLPNFRIWAAE